MKEILIVDQDLKLSNLLKSRFARQGSVRAVFAESKEEALVKLEQDSLAIIILELRAANEQEAELLEIIHNVHEAAHIPIVVTLPRCDTSFLVYLMNLGATEYIFRPYDFDELMAIVRRYV